MLTSEYTTEKSGIVGCIGGSSAAAAAAARPAAAAFLLAPRADAALAVPLAPDAFFLPLLRERDDALPLRERPPLVRGVFVSALCGYGCRLLRLGRGGGTCSPVPSFWTLRKYFCACERIWMTVLVPTYASIIFHSRL